MKKIVYFLLATIFILVSCSKENATEDTFLSGKTIVLKGVMPEVTAPVSTRMLFDYTDGGQTILNNIVFQWEVGDKVQLCFVQGANIWSGNIEGTVSAIEDAGKTCYFNLPIPTGLDVNSNYWIYGAAGGTAAGGAKFIAGTTQIETLNSVGNQHFDLTNAKANAVVVFKKAMPEGMFTRVEFNHIGAFLALRIFNTAIGSDVLNFSEALLESKSNPQANWYYGGTVKYDVATGAASQEEKAVAKFVPSSVPMTINSGANTGLLWQWIVPFTASATDLQLRIPTTPATTPIDMPSITLQPGKYYRISRNWTGNLGGSSATTFCTNSTESVIKIKATFGVGGAWFDLNNNGIFDAGDVKTTNNGNYNLPLPASPRPYCYTVYGDLTGLDATGNGKNKIISAITYSPLIENLNLSNNTIDIDNLLSLLQSLPDRTGKTTGTISLYSNNPAFSVTNGQLNVGSFPPATVSGINQLLTNKNWKINA